MLFDLLKPAIYTLDPERAHRLTIAALRAKPMLKSHPVDGPLAVDVAGLRFPNPVGLAAGFDKDAEVPDAMLAMGFGFSEVGSITPAPASRQSQTAAVPPGRRPRCDQPDGLQQ